MRKDLDEKLCNDYPEIFKERKGNPRETAMCWGFECGDGWYPLLDFLCSSIMNSVRSAQHKVDFYKKTLTEDQSQWNDWQKESYTPEKLLEAEKALEEAKANIPAAIQVKEKFGGLRFYVTGGTDKHYEMISMVEAMSYRVCEECGSMMDTTTYTMNWHSTLCPKHGEEKYGQEAHDYRNKTGRFAQGDTND